MRKRVLGKRFGMSCDRKPAKPTVGSHPLPATAVNCVRIHAGSLTLAAFGYVFSMDCAPQLDDPTIDTPTILALTARQIDGTQAGCSEPD